jgi:hypothetical protein
MRNANALPAWRTFGQLLSAFVLSILDKAFKGEL